MVAVAITQNLLIEQAMTEALHHLELEALIRGKLVAVKPNDTWASAEDTTAVTQPDTLQMDVVAQEGATFFDHNRPPFTAVPLEYKPEAEVEGPQRSVMVNPRMLQYETLIALNQMTCTPLLPPWRSASRSTWRSPSGTRR